MSSLATWPELLRRAAYAFRARWNGRCDALPEPFCWGCGHIWTEDSIGLEEIREQQRDGEAYLCIPCQADGWRFIPAGGVVFRPAWAALEVSRAPTKIASYAVPARCPYRHYGIGRCELAGGHDGEHQIRLDRRNSILVRNEMAVSARPPYNGAR